VTQVLASEDDSSSKQLGQQILNSNYQNMGRMMELAGYHMAYKGKWHITKPTRHVKNTDKKIQKKQIRQTLLDRR
jgi:arylsulfatase A-like enzyme